MAVILLRESGRKGSFASGPKSSTVKVSLLALVLLVFLGLPLALLTSSPIRPANGQDVSSSSSQASGSLSPFSGSVSSESAPPGGQMALDLGTNTFSFSGSKISWARSTGNMTIASLVSVNSSSVAAQLTPTTEKNSTLIEYSYSHNFGASSFSQDLVIKNTTASLYDREIVLTGSSTGPAGALTEAIQLQNLANFTASVCDSGCIQQCFGTMCFDWTGDSATYDNQTHVVTFTLGSVFTIDPLAVDGSGKCNPTASSCGISLTTSSAPDVIIVACGVPDAGSGSTHCNKPTASATGLGTFSFRASEALSTTNNVTEWYAVASDTLASATITCNLSASTNFGCNVFGVSDSNTGTPFDSNAALPAKNTGTNSHPTVSTVSTSNANDMLIGLTEDKGSTVQTGGTCVSGLSCTLIQSTSGAPVVASEEEVVTSTQSSQSIAFGASTGSGNGWAMIADAIKQSASVTQPITCTTANAATEATMTLSGASVSPTTLLCNGAAHNFTANPSQVITLTVPTDGSTSRYRLASGATSTTVTTCASGTCSGGGSASFTIYYQYSQSVAYAMDSCDSGATCSAPNLTYTQSGSSTYSTLSTTSSTYWIDYGTTASVPSSLTDSLGDVYYPYSYSWLITGANVIANPVTYWCGL